MHDLSDMPFRWNDDGWGVVGTNWGESRSQVLTYFRRLQAAQREEPDGSYQDFENADPKIRFATGAIRDLVSIGWKLRISRDGDVRIRPSQETDLSAEAVRAVQLHSRDDQLRRPAIRKFITGLERRRLDSTGWHSIFSLMRDGSDLARQLETVESASELNRVIDPYIQVADPNLKCEWTGLNLYDIWRYFRHTWVTPYQSVPGRSVSFLIRDRAAENHPVIGIAALASAVVHQTSRDFLIGWQGNLIVEEIRSKPTYRWAKWLFDTLDRFFESIYVVDLIADGTLRELDLRRPDADLIKKLEEEAALWKARHEKDPSQSRINQSDVDAGTVNWEEKALAPLYRSKRCRLLASFLKIRKSFNECGFKTPTVKALRLASGKTAFRDAVSALVSRVKSERVGIDMMDITVCGAVPPYNHLLGGKLVCMLLTSPEVQRTYERRYGAAPSIIASALNGKKVIRKPKLVCLSTTSLYGRNSSQYNRVSIPAVEIGGVNSDVVKYFKGGDQEKEVSHRSKGFGTFHFRNSTVAALDEWINGAVDESKDASLKKVNYIFGEGTSPKLRKMRDSITNIGLPGEEALKHERSRLVFYIPLAKNVRNFLLGLDKKPQWLFPQQPVGEITGRIADYWRRRWLDMRRKSPEVMEKVSEHILAYPVTHGARVRLPEIQDDDDDLKFDFDA